MKKYSLTEEHRAQMKPWADKWIANAMSTKPMDDEERAICRKAVAELYEAAGQPAPKRVVFVPSPFVGRFASGFASAVWWMRKNDGKRVSTADATRAATNAATYDATHAATEDATDAATHAATDAATYDATHDATYAATLAATYDATEDATYDATDSATRAATNAATEDATDAATDSATRAATNAATEDATYDATDAATDDATLAATDSATRAATIAATDAKNEPPTWALVPGLSSIAAFGRSLAPNGLALSCAEAAWRLYHGGNQWSGWASWPSFFRHVVKLPISWAKWDCWEQLALHSGWRFVHDEFCIVCDRPEVLTVDAENRPHNDNGPFCRWRDGTALYAVHGVRVPWDVIERPASITVARIDAEQNAEVRRVMIERYGQARFLVDGGAKAVASDDYGTLYRRELAGDEPIVMVKVVNSTAELDGSFKDYFIRVPQTVKTAREAVAWSFGKTADEYAPEVQT